MEIGEGAKPKNCWLSGVVFSVVGALLYFGGRAVLEGIANRGLLSMNQSDLLAIPLLAIGTIYGEAGLVLGGAILTAALVNNLSGKSVGKNKATLVAKIILFTSVAAFTALIIITVTTVIESWNSASIFPYSSGRRRGSLIDIIFINMGIIFDIIRYSYLGGVALQGKRIINF